MNFPVKEVKNKIFIVCAGYYITAELVIKIFYKVKLKRSDIFSLSVCIKRKREKKKLEECGFIMSSTSSRVKQPHSCGSTAQVTQSPLRR